MQLIHCRSEGGFLRFLRRFLRRDEGGVAIYVSLTAVIMLAFGALVVDLSRLYTLQTELQVAVDASALAAAAELDGTAGAIARARLAAKDALVNNRQTFSGGGGEVDFTDTNMRFLHSLPASDDDPITASFETSDDSEARFVEVRAATHTLGYLLAPVLAVRVGGDGGGPDDGQTSAVAVAGFNQVVCNFPPLMICNPAETAANPGVGFDAHDGQLIELKSGGGSGQWGPGNFGLLDPPSGNQGTSEVQENLASTSPNGCFSAKVNTRTGSAQNPVSKAINVRFDMYENPGFGGNANRNPDYKPSVNVTKGKYKDGNSFADYEVTPLQGMGMPKHDCLEDDSCGSLGPSNHPRFAPPPGWNGDGTYDPVAVDEFWADYWGINHPDANPFGSEKSNIDVSPPDGLVTRMEMYNWEIDSGQTPINVDPETESTADGENGKPMNYDPGPCTPTAENPCDIDPDRKRRIMPVAVVNCIDQNVQGNTDNVQVVAFAKMFLTNPAESGGAGEQTIYAEVLGVLQPGVDDEILHDIVQLYR